MPKKSTQINCKNFYLVLFLRREAQNAAFTEIVDELAEFIMFPKYRQNTVWSIWAL